ncbi:MAG TPA: VanZ family protein [Nitrospirales bacterium]|nr:VanZ family protein [Nitrospirales bacterium]HIA13321.1 VanZ family protein [Nitrospirales bacterium]HIB54391.1 VanZ family protein [Nitrospirales bacterium]HIN33786.1 VanZ family protein [Nitrospirales bacterium]HIO22176.1 VanZ family protein [Nitrospirales bacterium]
MARPFTVNPLTALLVFWGVFIVYGTTIPFDFTLTLEDAQNRLSDIRAGAWGVAATPDIVTNLLLFLPWGFLIAARFVQAKRGFWVALGIATVTGLLLSLSVEAAQLFSASRTSTPRDVLLNMASVFLGVPLGWLAASVFGPMVKAKQEKLLSERPFAGLAFATALVLFFFALKPFDLTLDIGQLREGLQAARLIPFGPTLLGATPSSDLWSWTIECVQWTFVGGLFALALRERGLPRLAVCFAGAALCGLLGSVFEMMQLLVVSRQTDATSVVFALIGGLCGASCIAFVWKKLPWERNVAPQI